MIIEAVPEDLVQAVEAAAEHRRFFKRMAREPYGPAYLEEILRPVLEFPKKPGDVLLWGIRGHHALLRSRGLAMANWDYKSDNFGLVDHADHVNGELPASLRENAG